MGKKKSVRLKKTSHDEAVRHAIKDLNNAGYWAMRSTIPGTLIDVLCLVSDPGREKLIGVAVFCEKMPNPGEWCDKYKEFGRKFNIARVERWLHCARGWSGAYWARKDLCHW